MPSCRLALEVYPIQSFGSVNVNSNPPSDSKSALRWYQLSVKSNRLFAAISAGQAAILMVGLGSILLLAIRQASFGLLTVVPSLVSGWHGI